MNGSFAGTARSYHRGQWPREWPHVSLLRVNDASTPVAGHDLSVTLAPLVGDASGDAIKGTLDRIAALRVRHIQIASTMPGLRPRELDHAARRDLLAALRRRELALSGIDAWIPPEHFADPGHADRAVTAVRQAIALAADLGRVPVCLILRGTGDAANAIIAEAQRHGVEIADHSLPLSTLAGAGIGIDPVICLSQAQDPAKVVHEAADSLVSARLVDLLGTGMRGPAGSPHDGRLDVAQYKIALSVNGFRWPVIIDARQWTDPWRGIQQSMDAWRAL